MTVDCDLLVVGLGPVGDALSALARLHGLSVIAIDRSREPYNMPRAAVIDDEIMRIMQMIGITEQILPQTRAVDRYQFLTATRSVLLDFPFPERGAFGWAPSYMFHQPAFEAALRERMIDLGVDVRLGASFVGLAQDDDDVAVSIEQDGHSETLRARYVVGCDGGSSPVRTALGIALDDYGFEEPWLVVDTRIAPEFAPPVVAQQICDPARPITHMGMSNDRFRWEFMIKPGENAQELASDASVRTLIAPWGCANHLEIERKAIYDFHALVATEWRRGRVLLAGDAAHQMPPFAGQGMCSGIRDAANLAWKLAAVVHDGADDAILDSYQLERDPHTRAIIETAIAMGRMVCLLDPIAAAERDAAMLARKAAGEQDLSMAFPDLQGGLLTETPFAGALFPQPMAGDLQLDTVLGRDAVLIARALPWATASGVHALALDDPALAPFRDAIAKWLDRGGGAAVLIRPDRHVFGTGDARWLLEQWTEKLRVKIAA